jgi:hypothetical protein
MALKIKPTDLQDLVDDINNAAQQVANIGVVAPASYQSQTTNKLLGGKVFEAWVLLKLGTELADELSKREGGTFDAQWLGPPSPSGMTRVIDTRHRTPPWELGAPPSTGHVCVVRGNDLFFELHSSIKLRGFSGAMHEGDIVVRDFQKRPNHPRLYSGGPINGVVELKLHSAPIALGMVRQAALTRLDLAMTNSNLSGASCTQVAWIFAPSVWTRSDLAPYHAFATYSGLSPDGITIAAHYKVEPLVGIGSEVIGGPGSTIKDLAISLLDWRPT